MELQEILNSELDKSQKMDALVELQWDLWGQIRDTRDPHESANLGEYLEQVETEIANLCDVQISLDI